MGALFVFRSGLDLAPYKTLRRTLCQLKPSLEFYLTVAHLADRQNMAGSTLYDTGDEKTTTRYLVLGDQTEPRLLEASFTIDPYVNCSPLTAKNFSIVSAIRRSKQTASGLDSQGAEDKEPFASLQQFARGQTAQLAYCGDKKPCHCAGCIPKGERLGIYQQGLAGRAQPSTGGILGIRRQPGESQERTAGILGETSKFSGGV